MLERLVAHMNRIRALRESVVSATIYPAILLGVALLSLVFVVVKVRETKGLELEQMAD